MADKTYESRIAEMVASLPPKAKQPNSANVLSNWITQIDAATGEDWPSTVGTSSPSTATYTA